MREIGRITREKGKVSAYAMVEVYTKEAIRMVREKGMVKVYTLMEICTKEISIMVILLEAAIKTMWKGNKEQL